MATLIFVIILVAALTFLPALALGPIAVELSGSALMAGRALRLLGVASGMIVILTVLLGIIYPLVAAGAAQALFPGKADGSLVKLDGEVVGSMAGQVFTSPAYFPTPGPRRRPRPTTPPPRPSRTSARTRSRSRRRSTRYIADALGVEGSYTPGLQAQDLPVDMITTSASASTAHLGGQRPASGRADRGGPDVPIERVLDLIDDNTAAAPSGSSASPG